MRNECTQWHKCRIEVTIDVVSMTKVYCIEYVNKIYVDVSSSKTITWNWKLKRTKINGKLYCLKLMKTKFIYFALFILVKPSAVIIMLRQTCFPLRK